MGERDDPEGESDRRPSETESAREKGEGVPHEEEDKEKENKQENVTTAKGDTSGGEREQEVRGGAKRVEPPEVTEDGQEERTEADRGEENEGSEVDEKPTGKETGTGTTAEAGTDDTRQKDPSRNTTVPGGDEREGTEVEGQTDEVEMLREEVSSLRDKLNELETNFEEYKRVSERKRQEIKEHGVSEFATRMLKVQTTLHNAIEMEDFDEGTEKRMRMVLDQFEQVYTAGQIERIEANDEFDEKRHKAVETVEGTEHEPEQIVEVKEPGYVLEGKVLKPAHVVVAK